MNSIEQLFSLIFCDTRTEQQLILPKSNLSRTAFLNHNGVHCNGAKSPRAVCAHVTTVDSTRTKAIRKRGVNYILTQITRILYFDTHILIIKEDEDERQGAMGGERGEGGR